MRCEKHLLNGRHWSNPNHNFMLKHAGIRYRSTSYMIDDSKPTSDRTANQLAYMSYALFRANLDNLDKL